MAPELKIFIALPSIGEKELKNITDAVNSTFISSIGPFISKFEEGFSKYCGAKYGIATTSGTTALHLALAAAGVKEGDEVIIPDLTMIATPNSVRYCGAKPILVDSDRYTWNMDPEKIEEKITNRTKVIMPVHLYGHPCDMDLILEIAEKHNLLVIDDAAEAHGAEYKGRKIGSIGDMSCFSFYSNKIIACGEGGMIVTNNEELAEKARKLKDQAFIKGKRFWHEEIGFNYRISNLHAAIGLAQLERIAEFVNTRRNNAAHYNSLLKGVEGITLPPQASWAKNAYWMYSILIEDGFGMTRDELAAALREEGIDTRSFFFPVHIQPAYSSAYTNERHPVAEELSRKGINLPSGNTLTKAEVETVVQAIISAKERVNK
jgi:perosamine synthetase